MKELRLSLIEKADAYDRVSKEVKDFFDGKQKLSSDVDKTLEYLFPELKESEDERKVTMENNSEEHVNHPSHYASHPSGIECIEVARHFCFDIGNAIKYLWRAGLKKEQGMSNLEKEIEDCNKAIWYIKDHVNMLNKKLNKNEENNSVISGHYKHDFL